MNIRYAEPESVEITNNSHTEAHLCTVSENLVEYLPHLLGHHIQGTAAHAEGCGGGEGSGAADEEGGDSELQCSEWKEWIGGSEAALNRTQQMYAAASTIDSA